VRGFAALADFMIAGLASVPMQLVLPGLNRQAILWMFILAYHTIAIARWGRTAGRALLEIEVIAVATSRPPAVARAALRFALEYGPMAILAIVEEGDRHNGFALDLGGGGSLSAIALCVALLAVMWAAWRRHDKRTVWDLVAGTEERYRRVARQ
jgi:hypothetical protein